MLCWYVWRLQGLLLMDPVIRISGLMVDNPAVEHPEWLGRNREDYCASSGAPESIWMDAYITVALFSPSLSLFMSVRHNTLGHSDCSKASAASAEVDLQRWESPGSGGVTERSLMGRRVVLPRHVPVTWYTQVAAVAATEEPLTLWVKREGLKPMHKSVLFHGVVLCCAVSMKLNCF